MLNKTWLAPRTRKARRISNRGDFKIMHFSGAAVQFGTALLAPPTGQLVGRGTANHTRCWYDCAHTYFHSNICSCREDRQSQSQSQARAKTNAKIMTMLTVLAKSDQTANPQLRRPRNGQSKVSQAIRFPSNIWPVLPHIYPDLWLVFVAEVSPYLDLALCPIRAEPWTCARQQSARILDVWDGELNVQWQKLKGEFINYLSNSTFLYKTVTQNQ